MGRQLRLKMHQINFLWSEEGLCGGFHQFLRGKLAVLISNEKPEKLLGAKFQHSQEFLSMKKITFYEVVDANLLEFTADEFGFQSFSDCLDLFSFFSNKIGFSIKLISFLK